ncbi:uncharacterized protein LOC109819937 isoform X2 [Asparagus officinalis]|nr:uncharacterized protein LOC109819937 isoform X2 [Asparagus officinalis]
MSFEGQASNKPPKPADKDSCWAYAERVGNDALKVRCKFCGQSMCGGISRFKQHLAGIKGNCLPCEKVPEDVKKKVNEIIDSAKKNKGAKELKMQNLLDDVHIGEEEGYEGSVTASTQSQRSSSSSSFKTKGPMDAFASRSHEESAELVLKMKQPVMDNKYRKKARDDVNRYIGRWFYEAGIPFNTASIPSFIQMVQAIGKFGVFLDAPTPYELRETILQREVDETREIIEKFKKSCALNGCSILTDAWSDRKMRSIMNIVVHSDGGTAFLGSCDASGDKHDANYICNYVEKAIEELGAQNVVQIVTDGASNNMAAAKSLAIKKPNIFWTTCAAHTINLMLADIAKIRPIRSAIAMGRTVSVYIYSHTRSLHVMREFARGDLVRPGVTRFATAFLALESLRDKKKVLKQMFVSNEWMECELSTKEAGKKVTEIIHSNKFWDNVDLALRVFSPLVKVLRRVDGDKIPSMGFVYGDMMKAKEEIKEAFQDEEKKYLLIEKIIDKRFDAKLKEPLHKAGYYLNPYFYYPNLMEIERDGSFLSCLVDCMNKFYPDDGDMLGNIGDQLSDYQHQRGSFGRELAKREAKKPNNNPVIWWKLFGTDASELRMMAMRILSLTTSSSACERNWSTFEMIMALFNFKSYWMTFETNLSFVILICRFIQKREID